MADHARRLAAISGLRPSTAVDLPMMIEAAAQAAWGTDRGGPIAAAVAAALRAAGVILPAAAVIERAAIAGRAGARKRATDALLAGSSGEQLAKLDALLVFDSSAGRTPLAWLKAMPVAPKADHVREPIDRLRFVRGLGLPLEAAGRVHEERLRRFVPSVGSADRCFADGSRRRYGHASDAHQLGRYAAHAPRTAAPVRRAPGAPARATPARDAC